MIITKLPMVSVPMVTDNLNIYPAKPSTFRGGAELIWLNVDLGFGKSYEQGFFLSMIEPAKGHSYDEAVYKILGDAHAVFVVVEKDDPIYRGTIFIMEDEHDEALQNLNLKLAMHGLAKLTSEGEV